MTRLAHAPALRHELHRQQSPELASIPRAAQGSRQAPSVVYCQPQVIGASQQSHGLKLCIRAAFFSELLATYLEVLSLTRGEPVVPRGALEPAALFWSLMPRMLPVPLCSSTHLW